MFDFLKVQVFCFLFFVDGEVMEWVEFSCNEFDLFNYVWSDMM